MPVEGGGAARFEGLQQAGKGRGWDTRVVRYCAPCLLAIWGHQARRSVPVLPL